MSRLQKIWVRVVITTLTVIGGVVANDAKAQSPRLLRDTIKQEVTTYEDIRRDGKEDLKFYFEIDSYYFDTTFGSNGEGVERLDKIMSRSDVTVGLDSIVLVGAASIDGLEANNITLSKNRSESVKKFLLARYPQFKADLLHANYIGENWIDLRELIVADNNFPHKSETLKIIDDTKRSADSRGWLLKTMKGGAVWAYLRDNIFPQTRYGASLVFHYNVETIEKLTIKDSIVVTELVQVVDTVVKEPVVVPIAVPVITPKVEILPDTIVEIKPIMAVKTNLLFDAITALNIELEVPIKDRWSIAGEWTFPWWSSRSQDPSSKRRYFQMLHANLDVKYWFGNREYTPQLTGWFASAYGGAGYYDFENKYKGYQGEFWHAGLSAGYAHTINKAGTLRMEYSLGVGYLHSDYRYYEDHYHADSYNEWHPIKTSYGNYSWFGPTKARVSFVWMWNRRKEIVK